MWGLELVKRTPDRDNLVLAKLAIPIVPNPDLKTRGSGPRARGA